MLTALFPIGDDNQDRLTTPYVTYALIALNVLVFVTLQNALAGGNDYFTYGYSVIPREILSGHDFTKAVGNIPQAPGPAPIYLTILSAMFMHGSWAHLGGNMLYLWIFGDNLEDAMGHAKFLAFYLLCGALATFTHIFFDQNSYIPSLGASGAIAGVLGGYVLLYHARRVRVLLGLFGIIEVPAIVVIGLWAVTQFMNGFGSIAPGTEQGKGGVAYMAHVGGFLAGLILVKLFQTPRVTARVEERGAYPTRGGGFFDQTRL